MGAELPERMRLVWGVLPQSCARLLCAYTQHRMRCSVTLFAQVGSELPEPTWMAWDAAQELCALGYPSQVCARP